jgi:uncharacterized protein YqhQ
VEKRVYYGGQAVIEGVMMRGQKNMVTAVRCSDGEIAAKSQPLSALYTGWMRHTPLLRGIIVLIEALVLGIRSMLYSANVTLEAEGEEVSGWVLWVIVIASLGLGVALFFIVPLFLTRLLNIESSLVFNLVDGLIRVTIFVIYLRVMAFMPEIKRVFAYHGAEHKTVNAYEAGVPLEIEAVKEYGTAHRRCGTSFLFVVLIISIIVFALTGLHAAWLMVFSRLILIPVIAALSYEVIYFGSRYSHYRLFRVILSPGMWLQALTTREPDDSQLEVALVALKGVMEADQREEEAQTSG